MKQTLVLNAFPRPSVARQLSPNGRAHYFARSNAIKAVHLHVVTMARFDGLVPMAGRVTLRPTFIFPVHRKRDDDNLATGVLKAVRDALVAAKYLEADDFQYMYQERVQVRVEKGRRALMLEFEYSEVQTAAPAEVATASATDDAREY